MRLGTAPIWLASLKTEESVPNFGRGFSSDSSGGSVTTIQYRETDIMIQDHTAGLLRISTCPFSPGPVGRNGHQTYDKTGDLRNRSHDDGDHVRDSILYHGLWW